MSVVFSTALTISYIVAADGEPLSFWNLHRCHFVFISSQDFLCALYIYMHCLLYQYCHMFSYVAILM